MIEFDHAIPEMESIQDVLDYIRGRAAVLKEGEWIQVRQSSSHGCASSAT
jgi:hypothetical protein